MEEIIVISDVYLETDFESVNKLENIIENTFQEVGVTEDQFGNVLIALTEAVNNAVQHGNKNNKSKKIHLEVLKGNDSVVFKVSDEGQGFDFENLPDPTDPENIEKPDGRGIFLMRSLADEVGFNEKGNEVEIKFSLS